VSGHLENAGSGACVEIQDKEGADDQAEFTVEAFVARRRVQSSLQYLVKWQGYELVGQEAAYSWQWASELSADLDQGTYRRMVRQWRQAQRDPAGGSSDDTASDVSSSRSLGGFPEATHANVAQRAPALPGR